MPMQAWAWHPTHNLKIDKALACQMDDYLFNCFGQPKLQYWGCDWGGENGLAHADFNNRGN